MEKSRYSMTKPNLSSNTVLQKVLEGKLKPRKVVAPTKTQAIYILTKAKAKEGKHIHDYYHKNQQIGGINKPWSLIFVNVN